MAKNNFFQANQNYKRQFWPLIIFYVLMCCATPFLLKSLGDPDRWVFATLAVLNAVPIVLIFFLMGKWLLETDEYTRSQQSRAMLTGGAIVLSFATVWGFLELYQVLPPFWSFLYGPLFFAAYGLIYFLRSRA